MSLVLVLWLFLALAILLVVVATMIWQALLQRRLAQLVEGIEGKTYWRVCLTPRRFSQLRNFQLIWKSHGLLIDEGDSIRLLKVASPTAPIENTVFDKQWTSAQWVAAKEGASNVELDWVRLMQGGQEVLLFSLVASPAMGYPNQDELRDLVQTLFPATVLPAPYRQVFGMLTGRRTILAYGATMFLVIAAIVDTFAINHWSLALAPLLEHAVNGKNWLLIPLVFPCLATAVYVFFRKDQLPKTTKVGNAMLLALTLIAVAVPWAKRLDQWLPHGPAINHTYKVDASGNVNPWPADDTMPLLLPNDLRLAKDALHTGNEIPVELTLGALGLWQVLTPSPALSQRGREGKSDRFTNFPWELFSLPLSLVALWIPWQLQKRTMHAKKTQDSFAEAVKGQHFRRVELARPAFLKRRVNLIGFEALGILLDENTHVRLLGQWPDQTAPFDVRVAKADVRFQKNSGMWASGPARVRVEIAAPQGTISFVPDRSLANRQANGMARQWSNDLIRSVFPGRIEEATRHWPFALESSPSAMSVTGISLALVGWAAIDTYMLNRFALASGLQTLLLTHPALWVPVLLLVFGVTPWVFHKLLAQKVPKTESAVIAAMLGAALLAAFLPAVKRMDRHMATAEIATHRFTRADTGEFKPQQIGTGVPSLPPLLTLGALPQPDSVFEVNLIKGKLGLWQYDRAHLLRDVYCNAHSDGESCLPD